MVSLPSGLRRALGAEALFAATMMGAASLGFIKAFALAALLPPEVFGFYISALGFATIGAALIPFGNVEKTYKLYPILAATQRGGQIAPDMIRILLILAGRAVGLTLIIAVAAYFMQINLSIQAFAILCFTCLVISLHSLLASAIRAIDAQKLLPLSTIARGLLALIGTLSVALLGFGWQGILLTEALALSLVFLGAFLVMRQRLKGLTSPEPLPAITGGRKIWFAALITSTIQHGGRGAVLVAAGPVIAGAFGLLLMISQTGQLLAGALSQKLGPSLIRDQALGTQVPLLQRFGLPVAFLWALAAGAAVILLLSDLHPVTSALWDRYGITKFALLLVCLQIASSAYLYVHFAMMSVNRESELIWVGLLAVLTFYGGVSVAWLTGSSLIGYLLAAVMTDIVHTSFLTVLYLRRPQTARQ